MNNLLKIAKKHKPFIAALIILIAIIVFMFVKVLSPVAIDGRKEPNKFVSGLAKIFPFIEDDKKDELPDSAVVGYKGEKEAAGNALNVILGVEIRFTENSNDYLVYGVTEDEIEFFISLIPHGIENFYKEAKNENNLIIQAHPLRKNMILAPIGSIDGIESMNMHPNHHAKPSVAFKYARDNDLIVSGGSDFHHNGHHALCLMRTEHEMKTSFDVAKALKEKIAIFDCSGHIIIPYIY